MNSSSIVMAFILAGVLSVVIHNIALGPVVIELPHAASQTSKNNTDSMPMKRIEPISLHQFSV